MTESEIKELTEDNLREQCFKLLLDGARGIYIPQNFAENFRGWKGWHKGDMFILQKGPDHEHYWEAWDNCLQNLTYKEDGKTWSLHQGESGDLFAVNYDLINEWEQLTGEEFDWN